MPSVPEHITPASLHSIPTAEIEPLLIVIRERRLKAVRVYEKAVADKKKLTDDQAREKLDKQIDMLAKNIKRVDKAIDACEKRVNKVRVLRLQLGLE